MTSEPLSEPGSDDYPGLDLAYERAMASYDQITHRYDEVNRRLDGLLTLTSTVTLAAPLIVSATDAGASLRSPVLVVVAVLFSAVLVLGVAGRGFVRSLRLVSPFDLSRERLRFDETTFKLDAIYWAGEHFEHGMRVVWRKSLIAHVMTALFLAEVVALLIWIAGEAQRRSLRVSLTNSGRGGTLSSVPRCGVSGRRRGGLRPSLTSTPGSGA